MKQGGERGVILDNTVPGPLFVGINEQSPKVSEGLNLPLIRQVGGRQNIPGRRAHIRLSWDT